MPTPDIVWITLESVRQDHTSLGDHSRDTTPNLRKLAENGTAFKQCYSHDIWTRSSTASILSGHAPSAHQTWTNEARLPEGVRTIPEAFNEAGYRTVCVSPNPQLSHSTGLDRGFESFHYLSRSTLLEEADPSMLLQWIINLRRHSGGLTRDTKQHCVGYLSNQIAKHYIDTTADSSDPLFLYLHHGDTHHAYVPPIAWRNRFANDLPMSIDEGIDLAVKMSDRLHEFIAQDDPFSPEEWQTLRVLYDTSLAYVDHLTGTLIEYAQQQLNNPIFIVTADHGELFGENGLLAHMLVANTAVSNIPLIITGLDGLPNSGLIQHADVMRMLCDDLGIEHPIPVGKDIRKEPRQFAVTQRGGARTRKKLEQICEYNSNFLSDKFHKDDLTSIRTQKWRYQSSGKRSELFDISDEITDVSHVYSDVTSRFESVYQDWIDEFSHPVGRTGTAEFGDEMEDQLRDLGYL